MQPRNSAGACRALFDRRALRRTCAAAAAALALAFGVSASSASADALKTVKVGVPGDSLDFARWFMASDKGFFHANGLDVIFVHLAANTLPAALVSNGIQATPLSTSIMSGNLAGFDVKLVGQLNTKLDYMIIADKSIKTVADLKHKTIITGPPRGGPNGLLLFMLNKHGVDAKNDVKLLYIGSEDARRTLIEAHNADAIIDDAAHGLELEERLPTLHTLVPTADFPELFGSSAGVASDLIKSDPDLIRRMLRALAQTGDFVKTHPAETATLLAKELKLTPTIAKRSAEIAAASIAPSLVPSEAMYAGEAEIETMLSGKEITSARIKAAWDTEIAAAVQKELAAK